MIFSPIQALHDRVAHARVLRRPVRLRERDDLRELVLERELLAERRDAALERERRHRDLPAAVHLADDEVEIRPRAVEEDLVELRRRRHLHDRPHLDPRLPHRHEQVREALVLRRARVGPAEDEAPVGQVRRRRPDLLPVDHPRVARRAPPASARSRGPSPRSAPSSPGTTARPPRRIGGRKRRFCASVPNAMNVGPRSSSPMCPSRPGARRARTPRGRSTCWASVASRPPCSFGQPRHVHPAAAERPLPRAPRLGREVLVAGPAAPARGGELADEMRLEPPPHVPAERLVVVWCRPIHLSLR